jgi:hypothetical protein
MKPRNSNQSRVVRDGRPWQLRGPRPRRRTPRVLIDNLTYVDIRSLGRRKQFPPNWHDVYSYDTGLLYPGIKTIRTTRAKIAIEFYGGTNQTIPVKWYRPGFGGHRAVGKCQCGRSAFRFYKLHSRLVCKRCTGGLYASQRRNSDSRAYISLARLKTFMHGLPKGTHAQTYTRLEQQKEQLQARLPRGYVWHRSKYISENILRARQRYRVQGNTVYDMR